jgi:ABC-type uncharacterized transport system ATPase subunit
MWLKISHLEWKSRRHRSKIAARVRYVSDQWLHWTRPHCGRELSAGERQRVEIICRLPQDLAIDHGRADRADPQEVAILFETSGKLRPKAQRFYTST